MVTLWRPVVKTVLKFLFLSKTNVFDRDARGHGFRLQTREKASQNSFLIPTSQKLIVRMSLERAEWPRSRPSRDASLSDKPKRHPLTRNDGEIHGAGYRIGYARVSTLDHNLALQQDALKEAGCEKIYIEQMS